MFFSYFNTLFQLKSTQGGSLKAILLGFLFLFLTQNSHAASPVWQVSKDGKHFYLGGTIHLLSKDDYPLPKGFQIAYDNSQALVLEIDLGKTTGADFQQNLMALMSYPPGQKLQHHMSKKGYLALAEHFKQNGQDIEKFNRFKVGYISMLLTVFELQKLNMAGTGVDQYFFDMAEKDRKMVVGLESLQQHFSALAEMGKGYEDELIAHSLAELSTLKQQLAAMKSAWKTGDLETFENIAVTQMKSEFPKIYHQLLVVRNQAWLPKIASLINANKTSLVLVGHAHLVGEDGLIQQLKLKGFTFKETLNN